MFLSQPDRLKREKQLGTDRQFLILHAAIPQKRKAHEI